MIIVMNPRLRHAVAASLEEADVQERAKTSDGPQTIITHRTPSITLRNQVGAREGTPNRVKIVESQLESTRTSRSTEGNCLTLSFQREFG
ncbi:MAG: hypothetical protein ABJD68_04865, partial [Nakamurella sp.]